MDNLSIAIDGGHSMFKVRAASLASPDERLSFPPYVRIDVASLESL